VAQALSQKRTWGAPVPGPTLRVMVNLNGQLAPMLLNELQKQRPEIQALKAELEVIRPAWPSCSPPSTFLWSPE